MEFMGEALETDADCSLISFSFEKREGPLFLHRKVLLSTIAQ
jgi:hypothetical protein